MKRNHKFQSNRQSNRVRRRSTTLKSIKKSFNRSELTVAQAYNIVAGYRPANSTTYDRAVKVLRDNKINKKFVSLLMGMRSDRVSFDNVSPDVYAKNLQTAYTIFNNSKHWSEAVLADEEVRRALESMVISGSNGVIVDEERQNMNTVIANTGILHTVNTILVSPTVIDGSKENIRKMVTDSTLNVVMTQRAEELRDNSEKHDMDAESLNKASNFDEQVEVKGNRFISLWEKCKKNVNSCFDAAVRSVNKEVKIFVNKCRKAAAIFLAATTLTASVASCGPNSQSGNQKATTEQVAPQNNAPAPKQEVKKEEAKQEAKQEISVPTEYSADMGLTRGAWSFDNVKKYFGERFEQAYKNIPDSLLTNGDITLTRMQFLDQLRGHNEMNTPGAENVVKALTPCEGEQYNLTKADVAFIFTAIPQGDREVIATGLTYDDCTPKRHYQKIVKEVTPDTLQTLPDTLNNDSLNNDSLTINGGIGEVRFNSDTTTVKVPSQALKAEYLKSNVSPDGTTTDTLTIRDASLNEIVSGVNVADKKIKVGGQQATVSADSLATAQSNPRVDYMKGDQNGLTEVVDSATIGDVLNLKVDESRKIKVEGQQATASADSLGANKLSGQTQSTTFTSGGETIVFDDDLSEKGDSTLNNVVRTLSDSTLVGNSVNANSIASNFNSTTTELTDSVEIVFGTDSVEIGTPSAGYVPERGGYNNTGLNKGALKTDREFYEDKYGHGAYDAYYEKLEAHPELFANGAAFGGWVPEQALHAWRTTEKWSDNNIENKFADSKMVSVNIVMENFMDNKCGKDSLTTDEQSLMFEVFSNVTTTGRIFGVKGDKAVWNPTLRANDDCGTPSTRVIEQTNSALSGPWGRAMPRIFAKDSPITVNDGQGEIWVNTYVTEQEVASQAISALYEKSNMDSQGNITDTTVKEQVPVNEVIKNVRVNPNKRIKVQQPKTKKLSLKEYKKMKDKTK